MAKLYERNFTLFIRAIFILISSVLLTGCTSHRVPSVEDMLNGMGRIPDRNIIREGLPNYIIIVEGMLGKNPTNQELLKAAAQLYTLYGSFLEDNEPRARVLTEQGLEYALTAASLTIPGFKSARNISFHSYENLLHETSVDTVDMLFFTGSVWLEWMRVRKDDLEAIADLPRVQVLLKRVVQMDPDYRYGMASFYLALLASIGQEDEQTVRKHIQNAQDAADGKNILPEVFLSIRLMNDGHVTESCQRLEEIIKSGVPDNPSLLYLNTLGIRQAQQTLTELQNSGNCGQLEHGKE